MTIIQDVEIKYVNPLFEIFKDTTKTPMERTMAFYKSGKIQKLYKNPKDAEMMSKAKAIFDDATVFNVDENGQIQEFDEEEQVVYNSLLKNPNTPINEEMFEGEEPEQSAQINAAGGKRRKKSTHRNKSHGRSRKSHGRSRSRKSHGRSRKSRKSHRK